MVASRDQEWSGDYLCSARGIPADTVRETETYKPWTNPDDVVLSPFAGIGSEVYTAVKMGRRGVGIELKESYYKQACANVRAAEKEAGQVGLFA